MRRSFSTLIAALVLVGCDPIASVGAVVVDPSGAPVAGAKVRFECPDHGFGDSALVTTDARGKFVYSRIPDIDARCKMRVEKEGFAARTLTRSEVAYTSRMVDPASLPKVQLQPAE